MGTTTATTTTTTTTTATTTTTTPTTTSTTTASTTQATTTQEPVSCLLDIPYSNKAPSGCNSQHVNWKGSKVTRTSFRGKGSRVLRFAVNNAGSTMVPSNADYTGFLGFSKTKCGIDFVNGLIDGRVALSLV